MMNKWVSKVEFYTDDAKSFYTVLTKKQKATPDWVARKFRKQQADARVIIITTREGGSNKKTIKKVVKNTLKKNRLTTEQIAKFKKIGVTFA